MHCIIQATTTALLLLLLLGATSLAKQTSTTVVDDGRNERNITGLRHLKFRNNDEVDRESMVANEYIIKLRRNRSHLRSRLNVTSTIRNLLLKTTAPNTTVDILFTYDHVFKGAAIRGILQEHELISLLDSNLVEYVAPNGKVQAAATQYSPGWNLDRIDQKDYPLSSSYTYNYTGKNVEVFIVDSGIRMTHSEFVGSDGKSRVTCGFNAVDDSPVCRDRDPFGHGTMVASIVGGNTFGVAKEVRLTAVKVVDVSDYYGGEGSIVGGNVAAVIAGLDYVVGRKKKAPTNPMVINMSIRGVRMDPLNDAVNAAVDANIFVVAAAGNAGDDACKYSPGSASKAFTVGATREPLREERYKFDNVFANDFLWRDLERLDGVKSAVGKCVDLFAPGSNIPCADSLCDPITCNIFGSGTSFAAPHVTGAAALYLQKFPTIKPASIAANLKNTARKGNLAVSGGTWTPETPDLFLSINIPL